MVDKRVVGVGLLLKASHTRKSAWIVKGIIKRPSHENSGPHLFCWYTLLCTWLRIQEQISVNVDCGHMNRETALMRLGLSYRNTSRTRKEKETMWYSSHGCGSALQKTLRHCPLQDGRNMGTLAERH